MANSDDYIRRIDEVKTGYLDALWDPENLWYSEIDFKSSLTKRPYTWTNAFMLEAIAILAARGKAGAEDRFRAARVAEKLVESPCYFGEDWHHFMNDSKSDSHQALANPVLEALAYAYRYSSQLGLSPTLTEKIKFLCVSKADRVMNDYIPTAHYRKFGAPPHETLNNQDSAKWFADGLWAGWLVSENPRYLDGVVAMKTDFLREMDGHTQKIKEQRLLNPDFTWQYRNYESLFERGSTEYNSLDYAGTVWLPTAESKGQKIAEEDLPRHRAWQRCVIGHFARNGYPMWDTDYGHTRAHVAQYWIWQLRALVAMVHAPRFNMNADDSFIAKFILDQALETHQAMDTFHDGLPDSAIASSPFGTDEHEDKFYPTSYNGNKSVANAMFVKELAFVVEMGVADAPSRDLRQGLYRWDWVNHAIHWSTRTFNVKSNPTGFTRWENPGECEGQSWGLSGIFLPDNRWLTNYGGGVGNTAWGFAAREEGNAVFDTTVDTPETQMVETPLGRITPVDYDTRTFPTEARFIWQQCGKTFGDDRVEVETYFGLDFLETVHRFTRAKSGDKKGVIRLTIPTQKNSLILHKNLDGGKTAVWDGENSAVAGNLRQSKYIHLSYPAENIGLLLLPRDVKDFSGSKVTVESPTGATATNPHPGKSIVLTLGEDSPLESASLRLIYVVTDGSESDAEAKCSRYSDEFVAGLK